MLFSAKRGTRTGKNGSCYGGNGRYALSWFQWWEICNPNQSWVGFKNALIQRFQPVLMADPFELLLALKQQKSVSEFITQFERFAGVIKGLDEQHLMKIFSNGLQEEIRAELKLYKTINLSKIMNQVHTIEGKNIAITNVVQDYRDIGGGGVFLFKEEQRN